MPGENRGILFSFACAIQKVDEDAVAFSIHPGKKTLKRGKKCVQQCTRSHSSAVMHLCAAAINSKL